MVPVIQSWTDCQLALVSFFLRRRPFLWERRDCRAVELEVGEFDVGELEAAKPLVSGEGESVLRARFGRFIYQVKTTWASG